MRQALSRELDEELGIRFKQAQPLIKIAHRYAELDVLLDVWRIKAFAGQVRGREGQEVKWVKPEQLSDYQFPAANRPIISAARLPSHYAILEGRDETAVLTHLGALIEQGVKLVQLRLKNFTRAVPKRLLQDISAECSRHGVLLLANSGLQGLAGINTAGVHLTSQDLMRCRDRPKHCRWLAASCHNLIELRQAENIGADFVVLAPVLETRSHPDAAPLGWQQFAELTAQCSLPVYALGGLRQADLDRALMAGAQGIAGISTFRQR
nr:Nudix family hydrolase [Methylomarinum sp. Ch1-1]MDP4522092.1 Nudix family hydrolase [Methylomarinum sp. Ch1-1]